VSEATSGKSLTHHILTRGKLETQNIKLGNKPLLLDPYDRAVIDLVEKVSWNNSPASTAEEALIIDKIVDVDAKILQLGKTVQFHDYLFIYSVFTEEFKVMKLEVSDYDVIKGLRLKASKSDDSNWLAA